MTIKQDVVMLWDDGVVKFGLFLLPEAAQYIYIDGLPCISIGVFYENMKLLPTFFHLYHEMSHRRVSFLGVYLFEKGWMICFSEKD